MDGHEAWYKFGKHGMSLTVFINPPFFAQPSLGKDELEQCHLLRAEDNRGNNSPDCVGFRDVSLLAPGILHQFL